MLFATRATHSRKDFGSSADESLRAFWISSKSFNSVPTPAVGSESLERSRIGIYGEVSVTLTSHVSWIAVRIGPTRSAVKRILLIAFLELLNRF